MEIDPHTFKRKYTFELSDREVEIIAAGLLALQSSPDPRAAVYYNYRPSLEFANFFQKIARSNTIARKNQDLRDPFERGDI